MSALNCFRVSLISTGGTIEKTYLESEGLLANGESVLSHMLKSLQLSGVEIERINLMNKDSLEMTEQDHQKIVETIIEQSVAHDGIVVIHGTDKLTKTGKLVYERMSELQAPCVFTGAMRPWIMKNTDALQNLVESFAVVQLLPIGAYVAMHNRVLTFPNVQKYTEQMTFINTTQTKDSLHA